MIKSYADRGTEDIALGVESKAALKQLPSKLWGSAIDRLDLIEQAETIYDFWDVPGARFEALKGDRQGQYSIRIDKQYRICFAWIEPDAYDVEIANYHKG